MRKGLRTAIISLFCLVILISMTQAQQSLSAFGCSIRFIPPDSIRWQLTSDDRDSTRHAGALIFKHTGIEDSDGRLVIPNIAIIYEHSQAEDVIVYSTFKRIAISQAGIRTKYLKALIWQDSSLTDRRSIGYELQYTDENKLTHRLILGHFLHNQTGVQVICDATEEVFPQVEQDIRTFLRSVLLTD